MTENDNIKVTVKTAEPDDPTSNSHEASPTEDSAEASASETPGDEIERVKVEAREAHDRFLRASAELENYKKRAQKEMAEFRKYANASLVKELLGVVDNLERAVASWNENHKKKQLSEGLDLTLKELLKIFKAFHVTPIDAIGETFDPSFHQAMMQEASSEHPENTVLREMQKGYMIHDRLLRPAMVVVSKLPDANSDGNHPDQTK